MKLPVEGFNEKQTDVMSQVKLVPLMMMVMVMMSVINAESVFVLLSSWRWTFIIQEVKNRLRVY